MTRLAWCRGRKVRRRLALGRDAIVAAGAATGDPGVAHFGASERGRIGMTGLARGLADDVGRRWSARLGAVVARGAIAGHAVVVPLDRGKSQRALVAGLAGSGCRDMCDGFATRMRAVVAADAVANRLRMIIANLAPAGRRVAGLARIGGRRVLDRLTSRRRTVVAGDAIARCALEATAHVAGFAIDAEMCSNQRKAGHQVIERTLCPLLRICLRDRKRRGDCHDAEIQQHC